ncbi:MAG: hypothetical protein EA390_07975 [Balneolaceae bacterium]|nr:MAG: hypothetical protein EA390_07975 [Balneolaceae bacterium]
MMQIGKMIFWAEFFNDYMIAHIWATMQIKIENNFYGDFSCSENPDPSLFYVILNRIKSVTLYLS